MEVLNLLRSNTFSCQGAENFIVKTFCFQTWDATWLYAHLFPSVCVIALAHHMFSQLIIYTAYLLRGSGKQESVPADFERKADYTLGRSANYSRANTETAIHTNSYICRQFRVASWCDLHVFGLLNGNRSTRRKPTQTRKEQKPRWPAGSCYKEWLLYSIHCYIYITYYLVSAPKPEAGSTLQTKAFTLEVIYRTILWFVLF